MQPIIRFRLNDKIQLKKKHPCGGSIFRVLRVGSEIRIKCECCGHDMTIDRIKLEKAIKQILPSVEEEKKGTNTDL